MAALDELDRLEQGQTQAQPGGALAALPEGLQTTQEPTFAQRAINLLPAGAGTAGGLALEALTAPLGLVSGGAIPYGAGIAGAGVAGGAGEFGRQLLQGQVPNLEQILKSGGEQAAYQAAGGALAKGAGLAGRALMESAIGRGGAQVAKTALREGVTTTRAGMQRLLGRIGAASKARDALLGAARQAGQKFDIGQDVVQGTKDLIAEARLGPNPEQKVRVLQRQLNEFLRNHRMPKTPEALYALRQKADESAAKVYSNIEKSRKPMEDAISDWNKMVADRARTTLHATVPGLERADAATQQLINVKTAIEGPARATRSLASRAAPRVGASAVGATIGAAGGGGSPGQRIQRGLEGAAVGGAFGNPARVSQLALLLSNPLLRLVLQQTPRGVAAAGEY